MKILQLCNRIPFPLNDGGNLAVFACTEGFLEAGVSLSMLSMNTSKHWVDIDKLSAIFKRLAHFKTVKIDNKVKPIAAFLNLFRKESYNMERFISKDFERELIHMLQTEHFDMIQLEGLYLVPYITVIRKYSRAKIALRQHNVEFQIWEKLAEKASNPLKKHYLNLLASRLKRFELKHLNDYDLILPISATDAEVFKSLGTKVPVYLHPFGIEPEQIPFVPHSKRPLSLYHIGAMDWLPNQESVNWLLEAVMPLVIAKHPDIKLYLAGRNMPDHYLQKQDKNIVVVGEVPDAQAFERDKSMLLVPLLSGGGVRIKIFQAMAMGKTIVTTSMGVAGIEASDGVELFIADQPRDFADKILRVLHHPEAIETVGTAARKLIESKYNRKTLIRELLDTYQNVIQH